MTTAQRQLGNSDLWVAPVALGCWPLAGVTSGPMTDEAARAVIDAALEVGVNHLDTAYAYGRDGESERRIAQALRGRRDSIVLATKVGVYWTADGALQLTGKPELLGQHFDQSLRRLQLDHVDLLYYHAPAYDAPISDTAGFFRQMLEQGKTRAVGVSNLSVEQMIEFQRACPFVACQIRYNWLQRDVETDVLPWCRDHNVSVVAYEPLALGLLTGKFRPDHRFPEDDWRSRSPLFTGEAWQRNLEEVERLRQTASDCHCTLPQWAVGWTISQPGVTVALCGAKRPEQIQETAQAMARTEAILQAMAQAPPTETN